MPDVLCHQCSIFRYDNICHILTVFFTPHLEESLPMISFHINRIPCTCMSVCFIPSCSFSDMLIFHAKHLFQFPGADFVSCHINEAIQDCRMAFHNIISVQIHSPADIFRNINAICPLLIAIRKSSIMGKLFQCICQNKGNSFFPIFFNHTYCSIRFQAHAIKVFCDCLFDCIFTVDIQFSGIQVSIYISLLHSLFQSSHINFRICFYWIGI